MAFWEGIREVPDSEDELLSSSPVDQLGVSGDKLSADAHVPHQAIQDAPLCDAPSHQDSAENTANTAGDGTHCLEQDQQNASSNDSAPETGPNEISDQEGSRDITPLAFASDEESKREALLTDSAVPLPENSLGSSSAATCLHRGNDIITHPEVQVSMSNCESPIIGSPQSQGHPVTTAFITTVSASEPARSENQEHGISTLLAHDQVPLESETAQHDRVAPTGLDPCISDVKPPKVATSDTVEECLSEAPDSNIMPENQTENSKSDRIDESEASESLTLDKSSQIETSTPGGAASMSTIQDTTLAENVAVPESQQSLSKPGEGILDSSFEGLKTEARSAEPTPQSHTIKPANEPPKPKSQQEIMVAELRAQKSALLASLSNLPAIQVLIEEHASSNADMPADEEDEPTEHEIFIAANKIVKDHIKLLHEYNELKDVGQGLMGLIADQRGVRIVEVQEEFGIDAKD